MEDTAKKIVTLAIFAAFFVLLIFILPKALLILVPFICAYIISAASAPLMKLFKKIHIPSQIGAIASILIIAAAFFSLVGVILYNAATELYGFAQSVPSLYESAVDAIDNLQVYASRLPFDLSGYFGNLSKNFGDLLSRISSEVIAVIPSITVSSVKTAGSILVGVVFTVLASFFMVKDRAFLKNTFRDFFGDKLAGHIYSIKADLTGALWGYVRAQLILMSITFCELFVGLSILRVDYSFIIAILIAIVDAIPVFGTGTVLLPWAAISLLGGEYRMALGLLIIYGVCLAVRQLLEPKIISSQIGLHPLVTLFAMYAGFRLFGIVGMILGPIISLIVRNLLSRQQNRTNSASNA